MKGGEGWGGGKSLHSRFRLELFMYQEDLVNRIVRVIKATLPNVIYHHSNAIFSN